jgi:NitT/TauT family transport system substrate-binding protein
MNAHAVGRGTLSVDKEADIAALRFEPIRFSGWPELKESVLSGHVPVAFMVAPMALKLCEDGVKIKIVYLGHRDGTAMMVHKDSPIRSLADLKGKRIAIPNRFSNQFLLIHKGLRDLGLTVADVDLREMPPPDMPVALRERAVDAIIAGEPLMGQTELDGYGRVLFQAKEVWPNFISCVLVVRQEVIDGDPRFVQRLVDGIARSGMWLDGGVENRLAASDAIAKPYYNQDPRLLRFVLSEPQRVTYTNLSLAGEEFGRIVDLAVEAGVLKRRLAFEEYADVQFSDRAAAAK